MKITAGFSFFALLGIFLLERLRIYKTDGKVFPSGILPWIFFFFSIAIPISWIIYAHLYNRFHDTGYFSTGIFPLWKMDARTIERVKENVSELWRNQYLSDASLIFFTSLFIIQITYIFKNSRFVFLVLFFMMAEAVIYILLQFMTFADHDYYTIDLFIILIFLFIGMLILARNMKPELLLNKYIQIGFVCFLLYNVYHCKTQLRMRYEGWWNEYPTTKDFHTVKPYLRQLGIAPLDSVVIIPEYSYFIHYLTNQRGWIRYADEEDPRKNTKLNAEDSIFMKKCINNGAKYLLVLNAEKTLEIMPAFRKYSRYLMGEYGNVSVYDLKKEYMKAHDTSQKTISNIFFGLEKADSDYYFSEDGKYRGGRADSRTQEQKYSGKHSVKLSAKNPFAFTSEIRNVSVGEEFIITVLRKGASGSIVASGMDPQKFYISNQAIEKNYAPGWDLLSMKIRITYKLPKNRLKLYLWYEGKDSSYFDDFRIIRKEGWSRRELL